MKEGFIIGAMLGAVAGMMIYRYSKDAQQVVDKGEKMIKKEIANRKEQMSKTATKK